MLERMEEVRNEDYLETKSVSEKVEFVEYDHPSLKDFDGDLYIVDGVLRNVAKGRDSKGYFYLLSQVVVGVVLKRRDSQPEIFTDPISKIFLVVREGEEIFDEDFGDFKLERITYDQGDPIEKVRTRMHSMELSLAKRLSMEMEDSIIIKDGTIRPVFEAGLEPTFIKDRGPVGLVKNVEDISGLDYNELLKMERGGRTKAFYRRYLERGEKSYYQVSTFVKLMRSGEDGFIRLDAIVKSFSEIDPVLETFDRLSKLVSELSIPYRKGRYPENLPVIEYLENFLRAHLLDPRYVVSKIRSSVLP